MKQITIAGKLGKDAETRAVGQDSVTSFSVAVDSREKRNGEWTKTATWFDVSIWGKRGEALAQYLTRGSAVCVVGDFGTRTYDKDGRTNTVLTVKASEVTLMGGKSDAQRQGGQRAPQSRGEPAGDFPADGFPDPFGEDETPF